MSNKTFFLIIALISLCFISCKNNEADASIEKNINPESERPNIVLIMTDQHQAEALSIAGNLNLNTPNIDKLANSGVRFTNAYVTFPLCVPARSSVITGKMPHNLGVNSNVKGDNIMSAEDKQQSIGNQLKNAGYNCAYGGKWHAHEAEIPEGFGFDKISGFGDNPLAEKCVDYLKSKQNSTQPFFLIASFDNPHNICEYARNQPLPYGNIPEVELDKTPQLPVNFKQSETFPEALKIEQQANKKVYPTENYNESDWRHYSYTYYRLVEKVDAEIGKIIDAIDDLGLRENTVIIFTSDHGDGNASHGWSQKTALFQESIKVPFIVNYKTKNLQEGTTNSSLISNGLDLYPTIMNYAGINITESQLGRSIKPILEVEGFNNNLDYIVVETKFEGKHAYGTTGRAVVGKHYKYVLYSWGNHREQFFNLQEDPYEMNNLIQSKTHVQNIDIFRQYLIDWCKKTNDTKFLKKVVIPTNSNMHSSELFYKPY